MLKALLFLIAMSYMLFAKESLCVTLFNEAQILQIKAQTVIKNKIPAQTGYDIIGDYIDKGTQALAQCAVFKDVRFGKLNDLKNSMKRANEQREKFKTEIYIVYLRKAQNKARREGRCTTNLYKYGN